MKNNVDKMQQRGCEFSLVLNDSLDGMLLKNENHVYKTLMCGGLPLNYLALIKHNRDTRDDGSIKTVHYHVVLTLSRNLRIGTLINLIADNFNGLNVNCISCEKCSDVRAQVRYLMHLDDMDKADYRRDEILTNNEAETDRYLNTQKIKTINDCVCVCKHYHYNYEEIALHLDISTLKMWRWLINDLIRSTYR